jgi:hypothetical protein
MAHGSVRHRIGGSMGTVPRQESVPNGSRGPAMRHRELLNGIVSLPHLPAHVLTLKDMI